MKFLVFFVFTFLSSYVMSKDYNFTHDEMVAGPLENSAPQIYLFNKSKELIYLSEKLDTGLLRGFKSKDVLSNSNEVKDKIEQLIGEKIEFNKAGFTLINVTINLEKGPCPPCDKQDEIINKIYEKLPKGLVLIHKISIVD